MTPEEEAALREAIEAAKKVFEDSQKDKKKETDTK